MQKWPQKVLNEKKWIFQMIVSFHPLFEADKNIICAGREPNGEDLAAIRAADAVILSQGCYRALYEIARENCPHVFPNYDARFKYPGKINQIKLFRKVKVAHPASEIFSQVASFHQRYHEGLAKLSFNFPVVFKLDWGDEGETVYLINSADNLQETLKKAAEYEKSGQAGFILQEYILSNSRTLRVVILGQRVISYWRIQSNNDGFYSNLSKGAVIDSEAEPGLQHKAVALIKYLCQKTGIDLAGFDVIFSSENGDPDPMLLEINYFFGRKGLGGSENYYRILLEEIRNWLTRRNLVE
jgi:ribosomal protein S6--L-glutamate ligase